MEASSNRRDAAKAVGPFFGWGSRGILASVFDLPSITI